MTSRKHDPILPGEIFGRLTVVVKVRRKDGTKGDPYYLCECECGEVSTVRGYSLIYGSTKSCGCLQAEIFQGETHGMSDSTEYGSWRHMKGRCHCKTDKDYERYGGRGIIVCDRWRYSFEKFYEDMGPKTNPQFSVERLDNDAGYFPYNCVWALPEQQLNNKSTNRFVDVNGVKMSLTQASRKLHTSVYYIKQLILLGQLMEIPNVRA